MTLKSCTLYDMEDLCTLWYGRVVHSMVWKSCALYDMEELCTLWYGRVVHSMIWKSCALYGMEELYTPWCGRVLHSMVWKSSTLHGMEECVLYGETLFKMLARLSVDYWHIFRTCCWRMLCFITYSWLIVSLFTATITVQSYIICVLYHY